VCVWGEREGEEKRRKERMRERMCAFWARKGEKDVWFLGGVHLTRTHSLSQRARVCVCARAHTQVLESSSLRVCAPFRASKFLPSLTSRLDLERSLAR
jgi:hypothetical protein